MDSNREGVRQTLGSDQSAGSKLHYKSTKEGAEEGSARSFALGSGRGSLDLRLEAD